MTQTAAAIENQAARIEERVRRVEAELADAGEEATRLSIEDRPIKAAIARRDELRAKAEALSGERRRLLERSYRSRGIERLRPSATGGSQTPTACTGRGSVRRGTSTPGSHARPSP